MSELYGKYRLLECISATQVAELFRAKSHGVEGFEKVVAIKRISRAAARLNGYIEAFIEEAKAAVKLSHANLVQVFDLGQVDRTFYLAMEHVNGPDLGQIIERLHILRLRVPLDLSIHLVCEVIKAIDYAHRRKDYQLRPLNLVHSGVHPWNILVSLDGEVKVTNFGALRLQSLLPPSMRPPVEAWSPYLATEVQQGSLPLVGSPQGQSADIYAAGAVLLDLLAGRPPQHAGEVDPLLLSLHGIPSGLAEILRRSLHPDPAQRYPRSGELYEALVALLFHAGLKPSNRALASFITDLLSRPLPQGARFAPREPPPPPPTPSQPALPPPPPPGAFRRAEPEVLPPAAPRQPPPLSSPRRAPVVLTDTSNALPALTEERRLTPLERPVEAPAPGRSPEIVAAGGPVGRLPGPVAPLSPQETVRLADPTYQPATLEPEPPTGPLPGLPLARPRSASVISSVSSLGTAPLLSPAAAEELGITLEGGTGETGQAVLVTGRGAQDPHSGILTLAAQPGGGLPTPREPVERGALVREAAILHLRAVGYASSITFSEVEAAVARWSGYLLPAEPARATILFYSSSSPARALMRCLHCALQLNDPADELARYAIGAHFGPVRLLQEGLAIRAAADDPTVQQALGLAQAANPGEVLCSEAGPLHVASEFSFAPPLHLGGEGVAHRVSHFLTVTTQRSSLVPEGLRTQVSQARIPGRERETQQIQALIEEVRSGRGRILAMRGPAGVGKSTLVDTVRRVADTEELSWFHVRLFGGFAEVPYWGLRALLGAICAVEEEHPAAEVRSRLERLVQLGLNAEELSGVASVFALQRRGSSRRRIVAAATASAGLAGLISSDSKALLAGMLHKVIAGLAAERPLVLVLEDLEHLDAETWGLLQELSGRIEEWPALLWVTSQQEIPLTPSPALVSLELGPPPEEALRTRLRRLARRYAEGGLAPAQLDELVRLAGHNPRHAEELLRLLGETGQLGGWQEDALPSTFADLVSRRLALLGDEEREVLQAAAAIGQLFGVGLVARVTRLERARVEEALQSAQRRGLLEPIALGLYAFRYETLPAVLYGGLPAGEAQALHERIASQIEAAHPEDRPRFLEELAHHYLRAKNGDKAVRYLEALADRMEAGHHYRAAISRIQAASSLLEADPRADTRRRIDVLHRLGQLAIPAMDFSLGRRALEQALSLAQTTRQERRVAQSLFLLGKVWLAAGAFDEALDHLTRALHLGQGVRDRLLLAGIYGAIGETYHKNGNLTRAIDYLGKAEGLATREGDHSLAGKLLLLQANCSAATGNFGVADRSLEKVAGLAGKGNDLALQLAVLKTRSLVGFFRKDWAGSLQACLEGIDVAGLIGATPEEVIFLHNAGDCCLRLGELGRAHGFLARSQEICLNHGLARTAVTNAILLSYLEVLRHGPDAAPELLEPGLAGLREALGKADELHLVWEQIQARLLLGRIAAARGEHDEARPLLQAAATEARRIHLLFAVEEAEEALRSFAPPPAAPPARPA
ncbi:MAG: AAA family ATPase [Myxococcota bacterium]|nr:AAA family ATPase [Myxococcota bacterium]